MRKKELLKMSSIREKFEGLHIRLSPNQINLVIDEELTKKGFWRCKCGEINEIGTECSC